MRVPDMVHRCLLDGIPSAGNSICNVSMVSATSYNQAWYSM